MSTKRPLSVRDVQQIHLHAQGLLKAPRRRAKKADLLSAIERMRLLQIDTIHVVARSPYLVLYSRLGDYDPEWLGALLEEGHIFECWAHEACFAPRSSYPLHRRNQLGREGHWAMKHAQRMHREHRAGMDAVLEKLRERGPLRAADFTEGPRGQGGWWGWKAEKRWLEAWFALGELMIVRRDRFQRVYDLRERVLEKLWPGWSDRALPDREAQRRAFIVQSVGALGVAKARWIADYFRAGKKHKDAELDGLVTEGALERVEVQGWNVPGYVLPALWEGLPSRLSPTHTTLLSPFDPVVWDRARALELFDFDYRIECYTPEPKRKYGYYVLPILDRGALIGRLDAKAHRAEGRFEIKALYLEPGVELSSALVERLAAAIAACARWHETPEVSLRRSTPTKLGAAVKRALRGL